VDFHHPGIDLGEEIFSRHAHQEEGGSYKNCRTGQRKSALGYKFAEQVAITVPEAFEAGIEVFYKPGPAAVAQVFVVRGRHQVSRHHRHQRAREQVRR
jgi:hypothetical protein